MGIETTLFYDLPALLSHFRSSEQRDLVVLNHTLACGGRSASIVIVIA